MSTRWVRDLGARRLARRAWREVEERVARAPRAPSPVDHPDWDAWFEEQPIEFLRERRALVTGQAWSGWMRTSLGDEALARVLEDAGRGARGEFLAYGHLWMDAGSPVDWHRSPLDGHRWPEDAPHQRALRGAPEGVDIKDVWELGRLPQALGWARAHALTGDASWRAVFAAHLRGFRLANPYGRGVHWASGQEVAIRALTTLAAQAALGAPEDAGAWMESMRLHGVYLFENIGFSRFAVPNNHVVAEATALCALGHALGHVPGARSWRERGSAILREALERQFLSDGGYCQSSHTYHRLALTLALYARGMLGPLEPGLGAMIDARLARAGEHLASFVLDDGVMPNHGNNDGAYVSSWAGCSVGDFRPLLQATRFAAVGARAFARGPWDEALLWWFGPKALSAPVSPWPRRERFPASGWSILRDGVGDALVMRDGPPIDGLGQSDTLHVTFSRRGRPWLRDAGSYRYNGHPDEHDRCIGPRSHSAPTIDGADYARRLGAFTWVQAPEVRRAHSERALEARCRTRSGLDVTRRASASTSGWCVRDELAVELEELVVWRWLLPVSEWSIVQEEQGVTLVSSFGGEIARVAVEVEGGQLASARVRASWWAPRYGAREDAAELEVVVRVGARATVETRFDFEEV